MRLLLVRHGESVCGKNGVVGGVRGCSGLTERGFEQVRALRDRFQKESFRADVLLGSTLPRATQTAEVVGEALDLEPVLDPDLIEMVPGDIDGSTWNDWRERYGFDPVGEPDRPLSPNGESINSFNERLQRTFERLASQHDGQTVVACCHGGVVFGSLVTLGRMDAISTSARTDLTGITEWHRESGRWSLVRFNDHAHLIGTPLLVP